MYLPKHVYIIDILLYSDKKYSTAYLENLVPVNTGPTTSRLERDPAVNCNNN